MDLYDVVIRNCFILNLSKRHPNYAIMLSTDENNRIEKYKIADQLKIYILYFMATFNFYSCVLKTIQVFLEIYITKISKYIININI